MSKVSRKSKSSSKSSTNKLSKSQASSTKSSIRKKPSKSSKTKPSPSKKSRKSQSSPNSALVRTVTSIPTSSPVLDLSPREASKKAKKLLSQLGGGTIEILDGYFSSYEFSPKSIAVVVSYHAATLYWCMECMHVEILGCVCMFVFLTKIATKFRLIFFAGR